MKIPQETGGQGPITPSTLKNKKVAEKQEDARLPSDSVSLGESPVKAPSMENLKSRIRAESSNETMKAEETSLVKETRQPAAIFNMKYAEPEESVRIDIRRPTKTNDQNEKVENPLSPVGVDLGGGLFFDANSNITFNPLRGDGQDYGNISVQHPHYGGTTSIYIRGDNTRITYPHYKGTRSVVKRGDKTSIIHPGFSGTTTVVENGKKTNIIHPGFHGSTTIIKEDNRTDIIHPGFGGKTVIAEAGNTTRLIHPGFNGTTIVTQQGNVTKVIHPGFKGTTVIRKDGDTTRVIHPHYQGTTIIANQGGLTRIIHPSYGGTTVIRRN